MFWQAYMYDRNAALRVGRPPSIPEFDVSTEGLDPERLPHYAPAVTNLHRYWTHVADVQGAVSAKLYSPVGSRHTFEQRERLVKMLVAKLQSAWEDRKNVTRWAPITQLLLLTGNRSTTVSKGYATK